MSIASEIQRLKTVKSDIKAAIEQKGVVVGDGTIDTYAAKISEISVGGSVANPLEYVNSLYESYYGVTFPTGYELTIDLPNVTTFHSAFYSAKGIKKVTIKGNTAENEVVFNRAFRGSSLETIDLTEFNVKFGSDITLAFYYNANLIEILGELDFINVTSGLSGSAGAFAGCSKLVTITPKPNSIKISIKFSESSLLSDLSIQSIIDGLADLSGEEQYVIAGFQNGPDTFAYPEQEITIPMDEIHEASVINGYTMDDGAPLYKVVYGSAWVEDYAYKKVMGGGTAQTLTLHSTVGNKLTDTQKATITAKNWTLVY